MEFLESLSVGCLRVFLFDGYFQFLERLFPLGTDFLPKVWSDFCGTIEVFVEICMLQWVLHLMVVISQCVHAFQADGILSPVPGRDGLQQFDQSAANTPVNLAPFEGL